GPAVPAAPSAARGDRGTPCLSTGSCGGRRPPNGPPGDVSRIRRRADGESAAEDSPASRREPQPASAERDEAPPEAPGGPAAGAARPAGAGPRAGDVATRRARGCAR